MPILREKQKWNWRQIFSVIFTGMQLQVAAAVAATAPTDPVAATTAAALVPAASKSIAGIDLRPSWDPATNAVRTEDMIELGYQFNPDRKITYVQNFTSNLSTPNVGLNAKFDQGFIRTSLGNLAGNKDAGWSLSYQNRVYLPTADYDRAASLITMVRNYVTLSQKVSNRLTLSLTELPIFMVRSSSGSIVDGVATANAIFENRVYLTADIKLSEKFSLSVPLMFHQTRYANFQAGAGKNDSWQFFMWTYPEIDYALTENTTLGFAYYSGNIVSPSLNKLEASGWKAGTFQFALTSYL